MLNAEFDFNNAMTDASAQSTAVNYHRTELDLLINEWVGFQHYTADAAFGSDGETTYITLAVDDYLGLPTSISDQFDTSLPIQFSVKFRFEVDEPVAAPSAGCDAIIRPLLITNPGDQRDVGFSLKIEKEEGSYYLVLYVGR